MRTIREESTSTLIAAYRKEPAFPGDVVWEMAIAVTPLDKRPCQVLWEEDTVRYHIAPWQTQGGEVVWLPYRVRGALHGGHPPGFLVGLGISNFSEHDIWNIVKAANVRNRETIPEMFKDWVWDVLPVRIHLFSHSSY